MTTKKTKSKSKTKTTKRAARKSTMKAPPKTIIAAIDPQGALRFSSTAKGSIDAFVGKLKTYYRVAEYDLRPAKSVKSKPARKKEKRK
jgi:hypothetical protein